MEFDPRVTTALIAAGVSAAIFGLGRGLEFFQAYLADRRERRRLLHALHTEIAHNLKDLDEFLCNAPSPATIMKSMPEGNERPPHVIYARNMRFFDEMRMKTADLPPAVLDDVVRFYSQLEKVYATIDGFERNTFSRLTRAGMQSILEHFVEEIERAAHLGRRALAALENHAPATDRRAFEAKSNRPG